MLIFFDEGRNWASAPYSAGVYSHALLAHALLAHALLAHALHRLTAEQSGGEDKWGKGSLLPKLKLTGHICIPTIGTGAPALFLRVDKLLGRPVY